MENKELIITLLKQGKRYWGELLLEEYAELFQKIHSNPLLAEMISKDLGYEIKHYQIQNIKAKYLKPAKKTTIPNIPIQNSEPLKIDNIEQKIYDEIYKKSKTEGFNLKNL